MTTATHDTRDIRQAMKDALRVVPLCPRCDVRMHRDLTATADHPVYACTPCGVRGRYAR